MEKERYVTEFFVPKRLKGNSRVKLHTEVALESAARNVLLEAVKSGEWTVFKARWEVIEDYDMWRMEFGHRHRLLIDFGTVRTHAVSMYADTLPRYAKNMPKERPYRPALNIPDVTVSRAWATLALAIVFVFVILLL